MKKYATGYTTGVFDLFHIGHLNILKSAKKLCDCLIVGVSTDDLVESYKGKRPIFPFNERLEIISSIKFVDVAVAQESLDKVAAWEKYKFDALFHGDDWKGTPLYVKIENHLSKHGVDIVFLSHTEGVSTTMLTDIIRNYNKMMRE
jgi:glycerol-3-phosphate cytidylyltransferase